jgi:hypothetical protein
VVPYSRAHCQRTTPLRTTFCIRPQLLTSLTHRPTPREATFSLEAARSINLMYPPCKLPACLSGIDSLVRSANLAARNSPPPTEPTNCRLPHPRRGLSPCSSLTHPCNVCVGGDPSRLGRDTKQQAGSEACYSTLAALVCASSAIPYRVTLPPWHSW